MKHSFLQVGVAVGDIFRPTIGGAVFVFLSAGLFLIGLNVGEKFRRSTCVNITADVTKAEIDGFIYDLDRRGEWSVLVEPDGEYTVISRPRECVK